MVKNKIMFDFIKKIFIGLLTSIVNASNHMKCVSLNDQCMTQLTVIDLHLSEYSHKFVVNLDRCI